MQATSSPGERQSLQMVPREGPVRVSPRTAQEMWSLGLEEVWLVEPLCPRVFPSRTPARLQATTVLGFGVITQSPGWPAAIRQHFLSSFMCRNSSNWILCAEEDFSLNSQCKCRRVLGCVVGVQHSSKPCCHSRSSHVFQVESRLLSKTEARKQ